MAEYAKTLQSVTAFDDETIQSSENLLATFTKVRNETGAGNDIFTQATGTILDMSQALGQDTKSSAIQLGKALNDPIKGVSALRRVGVSFTAEQLKQIKALQLSGDTMGAQKVILKELTGEFGGSAAAFAKTGPGAFAQFKNSVNDAMEEVGGAIAPVIKELLTALKPLIPVLGKALTGAVKALAPLLKTVVDAISSALPAISPVINALIRGLLPVFKALEPVFATIVKALLAGLTPALIALTPSLVILAELLAELLVALVPILPPIFRLLAVVLKLVAFALKPLAAIISAVLTPVIRILTGVINAVVNWLTRLFSNTRAVSGALRTLGGWFVWLKDRALDSLRWIIDKFNGVVDFVAGVPGKIARFAAGMWDGIKNAFRAAINFIIRAWNSIEFRIPGFKLGPIKFGGFTLGLPNIPELAAGGIVSKPTLALLGEKGPERVEPLTRATASSGATHVTYNVTLNVPPGTNMAEAGRVFVQGIQAYEKRSGSTWRN